MNDNREVTIADVARLAGVSVSTVSRILNNKPDVAEATRIQVQLIIDELGFQPHAQARRLAGGHSNTIALLYPLDPQSDQPIDQLHLDFMVGAAAAAGEENHFFNVITNPVDERGLLKMFRSQQVDGIILMEIDLQDWRVDLLHNNKYPFVMIGRCTDNEGLIYLDLDLNASVMTAFDYLVNLGHQQIAYLGYDVGLRERGFGPAIRAWMGFEQAVESHKLEKIYGEPNYFREEMYAATQSLLARYPDLTAIVTMTDAPAAGVLAALRDAGYKLPRDFSVIGLAVDRIADLTTPTLTAIRFPAYQIGFQAARRLIQRLITGKVANSQQIIEPELVERGSTGPAPTTTGGEGL